jgi:hypothetical protein
MIQSGEGGAWVLKGVRPPSCSLKYDCMLFGSVSVVILDHPISDVLDCPGMIEYLVKSEYLSSATQSPQ